MHAFNFPYLCSAAFAFAVILLVDHLLAKLTYHFLFVRIDSAVHNTAKERVVVRDTFRRWDDICLSRDTCIVLATTT